MLLLTEPKTKGSRRSVRLMGTAVEALREHLERQLKNMERLGDLYQDQGLIFTTVAGTPINSTNLRMRSFHAALGVRWAPARSLP